MFGFNKSITFPEFNLDDAFDFEFDPDMEIDTDIDVVIDPSTLDGLDFNIVGGSGSGSGGSISLGFSATASGSGVTSISGSVSAGVGANGETFGEISVEVTGDNVSISEDFDFFGF